MPSGTAIAAIATAPGRGAVGIVRLSGPDLAFLMPGLFGKVLAPRVASYLPFLAADGSAIDQGLGLYFPAPHSFTGEDVIELQAHGGPVVLQLLLRRCLELGAEQAAGMRLAKPGEFSERAFWNGKLDLVQAEAIADLIDASTEAAARSASRAMQGSNSAEVHALRDRLIHLRMLAEANLDFSDEEIANFPTPDDHRQLLNLQQELGRVQSRARQGALLRDGLRVAIAGQPNVGKSSLLNALAGAELAIVTPIAGTTRDRIEQSIQIEGVPIHVMDTAGLRDSADLVEQIGIERAWQAFADADLVLFVHDLTRLGDPAHAAADADIAARLRTHLPTKTPILNLWNKADLGEAISVAPDPDHLLLSAKHGSGLPALRQRLLALAGWQSGTEGAFFARERHLQALETCARHLALAADHMQARRVGLELVAEEFRLAQNALNAITGEFSPDDLLGVIFTSFCIGK
jgi:tRNA modification GTPase